MNFIADFHVHSKFSRATARNLDLEHLHIAAQLKGITVIGTGDFTHPEWMTEISEKLVPAEAGLFQLKKDIARICDQQVPVTCRQKVRFVLTSEISNIYKKDGKTRKNHNLVFVPDLETARKFSGTLDTIGNIRSDGRPILGLDARDLLEIVLDTGNQGFLVPAHIWTPWFSLLGSKSGFDSIEACYGDLTPNIFAVETGLSSDPPMNWRVSGLDGLTLISNSDAHSPSKLGREANIFDTELSYFAIRSALKTGDPNSFRGTIEFFPEEGKYHLDGHRKCRVRLRPQDTIKNKGMCPVCGKSLTCGVLYRVEELADRPEGVQPSNYHPYYNLVPLVEILAEIFGVGAGTKRVAKNYQALLERYGSEFFLLRHLKTDDLFRAGIPLLGEALERVRQNNIELSPGYDGEFGRIKIFKPSEREKIHGQPSLFAVPDADPAKKDRLIQQLSETQGSLPANRPPFDTAGDRQIDGYGSSEESVNTQTAVLGLDSLMSGLNRQQRSAVEHTGGPLLIIAGPGTGKTRTLTHRIAYLISRVHVDPGNILAVTFTNKAAQEMRRRLQDLLNRSAPLPTTVTFHALCLQILKDIHDGEVFTIIDDTDRKEMVAKAIGLAKQQGFAVSQRLRKLCDQISYAKQNLQHPDANFKNCVDPEEAESTTAVYRAYQHLLEIQKLYDYEDLIFNVVRRFESDESIRKKYLQQYRYILVDEYQDLNLGQYRLIRALSPPGKDLFIIGDPDQAIYGFRGSDVKYFKRVVEDYPDVKVIRLQQNYRSSQTILNASHQVITAADDNQANGSKRSRIYSGIRGIHTIRILETDSAKAEAVAVGKAIEKMIGGVGFYSIDFGKIDGSDGSSTYGFSDFAVLYRAGFQGEIIAEILLKAGIQCQVANKNHVMQNKGRNVILSFLKLIDRVGTYMDFERISKYTDWQIKARSIASFIAWGIQHQFSLGKAFDNAQRFPVPGLLKEDQRQLSIFANRLQVLRNETVQMPITEKIKIIFKSLNSTYFDKYGDQLDELVIQAGEFGLNTSEFLTKTALLTDTDLYNPKVERVALLTLHAAKGLEFPVVFITGCETDLMPFRPPEGEFNDVGEERRLFYVGMTRARDVLYLTYAKKRSVYGKREHRKPSPFLTDIENTLKQYERESSVKKSSKDVRKRQRQLKLF